MTYQEMLDYVEGRIFPFSLNLKDRTLVADLYYRYPEKLIMECIEIGVRTYFRYDELGMPTQAAVCEFMNKLGGIVHNRSKGPIDQAINHIQAVGQKQHEYWNRDTARKRLWDYVEAMFEAGRSKEESAGELEGRVLRLTYMAQHWTDWQERMEEIIMTLQVDTYFKERYTANKISTPMA